VAVTISELLAPKDAKLITRKSKSHQPAVGRFQNIRGCTRSNETVTHVQGQPLGIDTK
jgi:hypothetical protein